VPGTFSHCCGSQQASARRHKGVSRRHGAGPAVHVCRPDDMANRPHGPGMPPTRCGSRLHSLSRPHWTTSGLHAAAQPSPNNHSLAGQGCGSALHAAGARHLVVLHAAHDDVVVAAPEHADAGEARDVMLAAERRLLHAVHLRGAARGWAPAAGAQRQPPEPSTCGPNAGHTLSSSNSAGLRTRSRPKHSSSYRYPSPKRRAPWQSGCGRQPRGTWCAPPA